METVVSQLSASCFSCTFPEVGKVRTTCQGESLTIQSLPQPPNVGYKLAYINARVHPCMCACVSVCVWGRSREYRRQSGPDAVAMVIIISFQRGGCLSFLFNYVCMT